MAYDHIKIMTSIVKSGVWRELSHTARVTYITLCYFYNWKEHITRVGAKKLVTTSGISRASLFRSIKELQDKGLILIEKSEGVNPLGVNIYIIVDNLFYSLNHSKDPRERDSLKLRLRSIIKSLPSIKNETEIVSKRHPYYIYNYYINTLGSSIKKDKKQTTPSSRWQKRPDHISKEIDKLLDR